VYKGSLFKVVYSRSTRYLAYDNRNNDEIFNDMLRSWKDNAMSRQYSPKYSKILFPKLLGSTTTIPRHHRVLADLAAASLDHRLWTTCLHLLIYLILSQLVQKLSTR